YLNLNGALIYRCLVERVDDTVDDLLDQGQIFALTGDTNNRLGAGRPHDQPAMAVEALGAACDRGTYASILIGLAVAVTDILGDLRQRFEAMANRRNRLA